MKLKTIKIKKIAIFETIGTIIVMSMPIVNLMVNHNYLKYLGDKLTKDNLEDSKKSLKEGIFCYKIQELEIVDEK